MEEIFIKLKIINDLSKIILRYLTNSQNKLLNKNSRNLEIEEIIKYDSKLMVSLKKILNRNKILDICTLYGKLDNMKWLFKNEFICDYWEWDCQTFECAAINGNLENMKWSPSRLRRFASRNIAAQCICFAN